MNKTGASNLRRVGVVVGKLYRNDGCRIVAARALRVETGKLVFVAGSPVDFDIFLIVRHVGGLRAHEVVLNQSVPPTADGYGRPVGQRVEGWIRKQVGRNRSHEGNLIIRVGREVVLRVVELDRAYPRGGQQSRKVASTHRTGKHARRSRPALVMADALVVAKKEKPVLEDWPSNRSAEDVLRERVLRSDWIAQAVRPRIGIELLILQQVVQRTVKPVGTGFQNGYDRAPISVSVGRVRVARDHLKFSDSVGSRVIRDQIVLRLVFIGPFD